MNSNIKKFSIFAVTLISLASNYALANNDIVIVDDEKVMLTTIAGKKLNERFEKAVEAFQSKTEKLGADLEKERDEIEKKRLVIKEEAFEKIRAEFESKVAEFQKKFQEDRNKIEQARVKAVEKLGTVAREATSTLATELSFKIVLPASSPVYFEPSLDITDKVIKIVDSKIKEVAFAIN
jgi:Skp family chaperone for outer membrane proteins